MQESVPYSGPQTGLRADIFSIAKPDGPASGVAAFLAEAEPEALMDIWFGPRGPSWVRQRLRQQLARDIAEIDLSLQTALDEILHHPRLQALEALWRSVFWLVAGVEDDDQARVKILQCRWSDVVDDLDRAPETEQTELFNKLYNQEFGIAGGLPFGMVVVDHAVRLTAGGRDDVSTLRELSHVAAAAFCPMVLGVDPVSLGIDAFADLDTRADLAGLYRQPEFQRYRMLRTTADARFLSLAMPRLLMRAPYSDGRTGCPDFPYQEQIGGPQHLLWAGAGFGLASVTLRSFSDHRWVASIRGTVEGEISAGVVDLLPEHRYTTDTAPMYARHPVDACLSDTRERDLNAMGLTALRPCYLTHYVAFYTVPTLYDASTGAEVQKLPHLGSQLHFVLCASRFAHYVKVIVRDWVGAYKTAAECQSKLRDWLATYTTSNTMASVAERARYPLRSARVEVVDIVGKPGAYACTVTVQPHFQIEQLVSELKLKTVLEPII